MRRSPYHFWHGTLMIFALLHGFVVLVLDVLAAVGVAAYDKDLEIALLGNCAFWVGSEDMGDNGSASTSVQAISDERL
jgi:hypothetical protein